VHAVRYRQIRLTGRETGFSAHQVKVFEGLNIESRQGESYVATYEMLQQGV
jgi:hypothetical protein